MDLVFVAGLVCFLRWLCCAVNGFTFTGQIRNPERFYRKMADEIRRDLERAP